MQGDEVMAIFDIRSMQDVKIGLSTSLVAAGAVRMSLIRIVPTRRDDSSRPRSTSRADEGALGLEVRET